MYSSYNQVTANRVFICIIKDVYYYGIILFPNSSKNAISERGFLSLGKYAFCLKLSGNTDEYPDNL